MKCTGASEQSDLSPVEQPPISDASVSFRHSKQTSGSDHCSALPASLAQPIPLPGSWRSLQRAWPGTPLLLAVRAEQTDSFLPIAVCRTSLLENGMPSVLRMGACTTAIAPLLLHAFAAWDSSVGLCFQAHSISSHPNAHDSRKGRARKQRTCTR